jgi:chromosome segregation ATPase
MSDELSFRNNIEALEAQLERARQQLAELEQRWETYDIKTRKCREALAGLRQTMRGQLPATGRSASAHRIEPVELNPDSGRPPRGARRKQIQQICQRLGAQGESFRTAEVLGVLEDIEGELTDGMKSYTYAVMTTLQEEDVVDKVGRGRWTLAR